MPKMIELMDAEKRLLQMKSDLSMSSSDMVSVKDYLTELGKYTSTFFWMCSEYYKTIQNLDDVENLLEQYRSRLMNEELDINLDQINDFIDKKRLE